MTLRRTQPEVGTTWWHQDGAFLGADIRALNVWLSLSHCGRDAPGLDIVPRRFDRIVETGTEGAPLSWTVSHRIWSGARAGRSRSPGRSSGPAMRFCSTSSSCTAPVPTQA